MEKERIGMVSIIIPVYNEEKMLCKNSTRFQDLSKHAELIFVDGGSTDRSVDCAKEYGRIVHSSKGRAIQMNKGAAVAKGEALLFLHADTIISPYAVSSIENKLQNDGCIGGCLTQRIDKEGMAYRFIENFGNMRAGLTKVFYGDQGMFVRALFYYPTLCVRIISALNRRLPC